MHPTACSRVGAPLVGRSPRAEASADDGLLRVETTAKEHMREARRFLDVVRLFDGLSAIQKDRIGAPARHARGGGRLKRLGTGLRRKSS